MKYFKKLRIEVERYLNADAINLIEQAYTLALEAHHGQKRHTGEAYITHPVAVALILAKMRLDHPTIIAALLHDVLEDTHIKKPAVIEAFGTEIAELVDGVSKLTQIHFETKAQAQAENFRKMIMAMARDIRVILVKLADRLHNMRTLGAVPQEKRLRIVQETLEIYAPIAQRLGIHFIRVAYEELGFEARYPARHRVLKHAMKRVAGNRRGILKTIEETLNTRLLEWCVPAARITGRQKYLSSIYRKMHDKRLSFFGVMDLYGFRIIVESIPTCYQVLGALHTLYTPMSQRFKDYIAIPKSNGYQSLHTTLFTPYGVPLEIQIRTEAMDRFAEHGIAAHWLYKSGESINHRTHAHAHEWIRSVLELQKNSDSSLEFIESVKIDLFPREVYVFTPKGEILEFPEGATPIDFAYAIHSDVGHRCIAAKVDQQIVALSTSLQSGQTIEIILDRQAHPHPTWLHFAVTGKAKSSIRHYFKAQPGVIFEKINTQLSVNIILEVTSRPGFLADITFALSQLKINITCLTAIEKHGQAEIKCTVQVENRQHLAQLMQVLRKIQGVLRIRR